jgi:hypothetical protein
MPRRKRTTPAAINVLVAVDDDHLERVDGVRQDLESAGMRVDEVFPLSGTIAGAVASSDFSKLQTVEGVASVEKEPIFHAF